MYIPNYFNSTDKESAFNFMRKFNFATLVSISNKLPIATHLPFVVSKNDDSIILTSHMSKANEQWQNLKSQKVLTIFSEPNAYISPKFYDKHESVPTWNYISIHTYGKVEIISDLTTIYTVLEKMINQFEPEYFKQWKSLSNSYKKNMTNGIVVFQITVDKLLFNKKLSQNKTKSERKRIIDNLAEVDDKNANLLANYMKLEEEL